MSAIGASQQPRQRAEGGGSKVWGTADQDRAWPHAESFSRRRKMARPEFKPTAAMRRKVSIAAACGMPHDAIAIGLGISPKTLRKHFDRDLSEGAQKRRMENFVNLFQAAKGGNVTAQKAIAAMTPEFSVSAPAVATKRQQVGKKEAAVAAAQTAHLGTDWEDLLHPPRPH